MLHSQRNADGRAERPPGTCSLKTEPSPRWGTDTFQDDGPVLDAGGPCGYCPPLSDLHTHFRTPGFEYKEDTPAGPGRRPGRHTFVNCMPNTSPVCS